MTVQGFVRAFEAIEHTRLARTHRLWGERASGPTGLRGVGVGAEVVLGRSSDDDAFAGDAVLFTSV